MIWSLLKGSASGLVLGGVVVTAASLIAPQPAGNAPPQTAQTDAPTVDAIAETQAVDPLAQGGTERSQATVSLPANPTLPEVGALGASETKPAALPDVAVVTAVPNVPQVISTAPTGAVGDTPVFPNPQSSAPFAPETESEALVSTVPATPQPPVIVEDAAPADLSTDTDIDEPDPVVVIVEDATESQSDDEIVVTPDPVIEVATIDPEGASPLEAPMIPEATVAQDEGIVAAIDPVTAPRLEADLDETVSLPNAIPDAQDSPDSLSVAELTAPSSDVGAVEETGAPAIALVQPPSSVETVETGLPALDVSSASPGIEAGDDSEAAGTVVQPTIISLLDRDESDALPSGSGTVRVNRPALSEVAATSTPNPAEPEDLTVIDDAPALVRYASDYDPPEGLPLVSLVLLDQGAIGGALRAVQEIGFPVTILVSPTDEGALERVKKYRSAGFEVAMTLPIPDGAIASDAAIALEASLTELPDVVALVDLESKTRDVGVAQQVAQAAREDGYGVLLVESGLGGGLRTMQSADVKAAEVFRSLDDVQPDPRVIGRFLEQAAFRARQSDAVVLTGTLDTDILAGLILWGSSTRSRQVAMAPLSAVLMQE